MKTIKYLKTSSTNVNVSLANVANNPELYNFGFEHECGEFVECEFVDDYGYSAPGGCQNAKLFVIGNEYGCTHIVHAQHESDAYLAVVDEMHTIEPKEVHEAYNSFDKLIEFMESKGHENNLQLRCFCSRWCEFYFEASTKDANYTDAWDEWELNEAYQYQSNSSGTGIVNVGHYLHMRELPWSQFRVVRKV